MKINLKPVAFVKSLRTEPVDDDWGNFISEIILADHIPAESLMELAEFSHLEVIYFFDKVKKEDIVYSGRPRGNPGYPVTGIFSQRKKDRPNCIGLCTVELLEVNGRNLKVKFLDAIDGTPVLDIKPVFKEFQPKGEIRQPWWATELMKNYW